MDRKLLPNKRARKLAHAFSFGKRGSHELATREVGVDSMKIAEMHDDRNGTSRLQKMC